MLYRLSSLPQSGGAGYRQTLETLIKDFGEYSAGSCCLYYDVTGNGVEELLCIYQASQYNERAAVYTISSGKPVRLMDEDAYSIASAPLANLSVAKKDGKTYVCLQSENGGYTHPGTSRSGTYKVYCVSTANLVLTQEVQYYTWQSDATHTLLRSDVVIIENGHKRNMTYSEYLSWLNSWTWVANIFNRY